MPARKFRLFFAFFPYGGNGAAPSEHPTIRNWFAKTLRDCYTKNVAQVEAVTWMDFADTPVTMTRNAAVLEARKFKADILIMVDSDNIPDLYLDPTMKALFPPEAQCAKPFMDVVLSEFENRWHIGPYSICAPYCGPPPQSPVYVFTWDGGAHEIPDQSYKLRMFTRTEASLFSGVGPCAAQPTGCIAIDMRIFEMCEPNVNTGKGWFYYEFKNGYHAKKDSTEDVTFSRDAAMIVQKKLGYNPLLCAWDCWAGHVKPVIVGKPQRIEIEDIEPRYAEAVRDDVHRGEHIDASLEDDLPPEAVEQEPEAFCSSAPSQQEYEDAKKLVEIYGPEIHKRGAIDPQKSFAEQAKLLDAELSS